MKKSQNVTSLLTKQIDNNNPKERLTNSMNPQKMTRSKFYTGAGNTLVNLMIFNSNYTKNVLDYKFDTIT